MTQLPGPAADPVARRPIRADPARLLVLFGGVQVVLGGLVAAVTEPLNLDAGSWVAAYLVLVGGVAQYAMGRAGDWFDRHPGSRGIGVRLAGWNGGNAAVIVGTLAAVPMIVDLGGIALVIVLIGEFRGRVRNSVETAGVDGRPFGRLVATPRLTSAARVVYLTLLGVLAVSIPVGLAMAHLRTG